MKLALMILLFPVFLQSQDCQSLGVQNCKEQAVSCYTHLKYSYRNCMKWQDRCIAVVEIKCESGNKDLQDMEILAK